MSTPINMQYIATQREIRCFTKGGYLNFRTKNGQNKFVLDIITEHEERRKSDEEAQRAEIDGKLDEEWARFSAEEEARKLSEEQTREQLLVQVREQLLEQLREQLREQALEVARVEAQVEICGLKRRLYEAEAVVTSLRCTQVGIFAALSKFNERVIKEFDIDIVQPVGSSKRKRVDDEFTGVSKRARYY